MTKHLIDIAYEIASKKLKSKQFSFRDLFKLIIEKHPEYKNDVGDLYIDLISDNRFITVGKDKWTLVEYLKHEEIQKINSSMFGLDKLTLEDLDENFDPSELKSMSDDENEYTMMDDLDEEGESLIGNEIEEEIEEDDDEEMDDLEDDEDEDLDIDDLEDDEF